jgi:hypothetical protein
LRRAKVPYFRIYDLRSTYATRLSAGGVADEWVTQPLRAGRCEAVQKVFTAETVDEARGVNLKLNGQANEIWLGFGIAHVM